MLYSHRVQLRKSYLFFFQSGFDRVGGYTGLRDKYMNAVPDEVLLGNTTCGIPRPDSFQLMREAVHSDLPWPGFLLGQTTVSIWYWCSDQVSFILCL